MQINTIEQIKTLFFSPQQDTDLEFVKKILIDALIEAGDEFDARVWQKTSGLEPQELLYHWWHCQGSSRWEGRCPASSFVDPSLWTFLPDDCEDKTPQRYDCLCWENRVDAFNALLIAIRRYLETNS